MKKMVILFLFAGMLGVPCAFAVEKNEELLDLVVVASRQTGANYNEIVYFPNLNRTCLYVFKRGDGLRALECWPGKPDAAKQE
ncbi:hypothetical protein [Geoalkalibacter halelectricus]|uniref:hypothetical protein n=1 Tax=Geoalkalibacter halelectricus TaxID=2847045 RepID=UPI003D231529